MKAKITYAHLQERVASAGGMTKKEAQTLLKEMTAAVSAGLVADGKVNLAGLGRFSRKVQSARKGRNPQTGKSIDIPEKNKVDFLPDAKWRRDVNSEYERMQAVLPPPTPDPAVKATAESVAQPKPAAAAPQSKRKSLSLRPPGSDRPTGPVDTETGTRAISPPAPRIVEAGDIPSKEKAGQKRRARFVSAVGVILILAAVFIFLWPRSRPLEPARPEPVRIAARKTPHPPETSRPEPQGPAAFETAIVEAAEAAPLEPTVLKPATASRYTVTAGDSLWKIADATYDYPYFWPVIFQKNHKVLQHPDSLIIGMQLAIPAFKGRFGQLAESDFQQLADGYLRVYEAYRRQGHSRAPYYLWVAYRLRAHWVPESELLLGKPEDLNFIRQLKGRGLIH